MSLFYGVFPAFYFVVLALFCNDVYLELGVMMGLFIGYLVVLLAGKLFKIKVLNRKDAYSVLLALYVYEFQFSTLPIYDNISSPLSQ